MIGYLLGAAIASLAAIAALSSRKSSPSIGPSYPAIHLGTPIAFGKLLTPNEKALLLTISKELTLNPSHVSSVIFAESGWNPHAHLNKENGKYKSHYTVATIGPTTIGGGLIGFMRKTAKGLDISLEDLIRKDRIGQLPYVKRVLGAWRQAGVLPANASLHKVRMSVLYPAYTKFADMPSHVLWSKIDPKTKAAYSANIWADLDKDGQTTVGEAMAKIDTVYKVGMSDKYRG